MIWIVILIVIVVCVVAITYPLFWSKLERYEIHGVTGHDFSLADYWLSALSDLEDDYVLGRISNSDYQQQKILLQRRYLDWQVQSGKTENKLNGSGNDIIGKM